MNDVFHEMLSRFVVVYLDDIVIYSRSDAEHVHHVKMRSSSPAGTQNLRQSREM